MEPIAIIGIGCRFPGGIKDPETFWQLLINGVDAITEVPKGRFDIDALYDPKSGIPGKIVTRSGGFIEGIDEFDANFFGISPLEAESLDPQQRLLLEVTWEALEDAGQPLESLAASRTGVFVGMWTGDYENYMFGASPNIDLYMTTGSGRYSASGRISYVLDLQGPSMTVDTACSSSLVAVHLACQSLRCGESTLAVAGGVNLVLQPAISIAYSKAGVLSPDGRCKFGDARANGYVRSDGCGVLVLKPLSDALADNDQIYALVLGSAVNHDGRESLFLAPSGKGQEAALRQACRSAGVSPGQICYVEAHGTGTAVGDPVELKALGKVLSDGRAEDRPCIVGSIKTNIGHTEAASGVAGLIKTALCLKHRIVPPSLHFKDPNPTIPWHELPVVIQQILGPLPVDSQPALAGINSFGITGTNAHIVLQEAPMPSDGERSRENEGELTRPLLLPLSARSGEALEAMGRVWRDFLSQGDNHAVPLQNICYTAGVRRTHHDYRLAVVGRSRKELAERLDGFVRGEFPSGPSHGQRAESQPNGPVFVFSGQGPQWFAMGRELLEQEPVYRETVERCAELLGQYTADWSLLEELTADESRSRMDQTEIAQPAIFALQMGLAALWRSWGIEPGAVVGHSVGEVAACCVAGALTLEQAIRVVYHRGRLLQRATGQGRMAAVELSLEEAKAILAKYEGRLGVAAVNSPNSVTFSGDTAVLEEVLESLKKRNLFCRMLAVNYAFHSHQVEPYQQEMTQSVKGICIRPATIPIISTVTGKVASCTDYDAAYWAQNIRRQVQFGAAIDDLIQRGHTTFLEISPHPVLAMSIAECLSYRDCKGKPLSSLRRDGNDKQTMLETLGTLYSIGHTVKWQCLYHQAGHCVSLPTYAWQRKRFWFDTLQDEEGRSVAEIRRLHLKQSERDSFQEVSNWLYQVEWKQLDIQGPQALFQPPGSLFTPSRIAERINVARSAQDVDRLKGPKEILGGIESLSAAYVLDAFRRLGWTFRLGEHISEKEIANRLGVVNRHRRLLHRLFSILQEESVLNPMDSQWEVVRLPQMEDPHERWTSLLGKYPDYEVELTLLGRCGDHLAEVLQGDCDPLQLLFPAGSLVTAEKLYRDAPFSQNCNRMIREAVRAALAEWPQERSLRILEIGAGTGGTTAHVLPLLPADRTKYTFTDVAPLFLDNAERKFRAFPFVEYKILDISIPPTSQNFKSGSFDLILASNVLHATPDLRKTVTHVCELLAPDGILVLLEGTSPRRWVDLIFGLLEGWWLFSDLTLRPVHPLLSASKWYELLQELGFVDPVTMAVLGDTQPALFDQSLILARAPQTDGWQPTRRESRIPLSAPSQPIAIKNEGVWVLFSDESGFGNDLAETLKVRGDVCILVHKGDISDQTSDQQFTLYSTRPEDFFKLLKQAHDFASQPITGVLYLWALDIPSGHTIDEAVSGEPQTFGCGNLLNLVQALASYSQSKPPRLWVVTRGAQFIYPLPGHSQPRMPSKPLSLLQACLWGLGRVVSLEYPDVRCTLVDLDPTDTESAPRALADELAFKETNASKFQMENQIAYRSGKRFVARLVNSPSPARDHLEGFRTERGAKCPGKTSANLFHPGCTYLITGGYGGLGLLTAQWMVEQGARALVLIGRKGPTEKAQEVLSHLEKKGSRILAIQGDLSVENDVVKTLSAIGSHLPPLKGIIHCAGVLEDGVLSEQTWERFGKVLAPKVSGSWHLHRLTCGMDLDFFILYSSWAGVLGSAGQGNHAAASAFMDALAHYRRALGLPAISIDWGPWSGSGAAARSDVGNHLASRGVGSFSPIQGFEALRQIIADNGPQKTVLPFRYDQWLETYPTVEYSPFFENLRGRSNEDHQGLPASSGNAAEIRKKVLDAVSPAQRLSLLHTHLREQISKILRVRPSALAAHKPFKDLGLDSLTSLELCNRLNLCFEISLSKTAIWNYPTINQLAAHIGAMLGTLPGDTAEPPQYRASEPTMVAERGDDLEDLLDELGKLSEEEVQRQIANNSPTTRGIDD